MKPFTYHLGFLVSILLAFNSLIYCSSSKKTIVTINKNLSFDSRQESSFVLDIKRHTTNDDINQIEKLLLKKITNKIFNKKTSKYRVLFNPNEFIFSLHYWFLFQTKFHFDRKDMNDEKEGIYSIILETENMKTSKRPGKTSLIIVTFEMESNDEGGSNNSSNNKQRQHDQISQSQPVKNDDDSEENDELSCCLIGSNNNDSNEEDDDNVITNHSASKHQLKVSIIGTANGISKNDFHSIISTLQSILETELQQELQLYQARAKERKFLTKASKERIVYERKRSIDKMIHPEKYSKPKGRAGKNGEASGRYRPSADAQARRTVKKGG